MPARNPSAGLAGVDGVLVVTSRPVSSSRATTSVKVPPVSIPTLIRRVPPAPWPDSSRRPRASPGSGVGGPVVVDAGLLLAGQLLDLGHHPVGDLAPRAARGYAVVPAADVDRLAERHRHPHQPRPVGADRLQPLGARSGRPGRSGRPRSARAGRRRCARGRAARRATACPRGRSPNAPPSASTPSAVSRLAIAACESSRSTGSAPNVSNHALTRRPLTPRPLEVVGLRQEAHRPRRDGRDHHAVDEAAVVAGQDQRPGRGTCSRPDDDGPPDRRAAAAGRPVEDAVEHLSILPHRLRRGRGGVSGARRTASSWSPRPARTAPGSGATSRVQSLLM